jgi:hypothetical protein
MQALAKGFLRAYYIPVEAKQRLARKHMAQLGQHQALLSTERFMRERVSVGVFVGRHDGAIFIQPLCQ